MNAEPGAFREGFSRFRVYNDGLLVYLYDPDNAEAILASVSGDDYPLDARNLGDAVRAGLIVLVELPQDDELDFEIGVGKPLTKTEKAGLPWLECVHAHLSLPSGTLRVDTANSLPLGPEEADEDGAKFTCRPGHYRLSLDRVRWGELSDEHGRDGAGDVITLQRIAKKRFKPHENVVIRAELRAHLDIDEAPADTFWDRPAPSGRIENGVFLGHVYFDDDKTFWVNLSRAAAKALELDFVTSDLSDEEQGSDFVRVAIEELGLEVRGCINGHTYFEMAKQDLSAVGPNVATGLPQTDFFDGQPLELVRFSWDHNTRKIKKSEIERWFEVRITKEAGAPGE